jgi:hypothetical protein
MLLALFCIWNDGYRANILGEIIKNAKVVMVLLDFGRYILPLYSILDKVHNERLNESKLVNNNKRVGSLRQPLST